MRRRWPELELGLADAVWRGGQGTFSAQIVGPHFEGICRSYATLHGAEAFGELPAEVGSGTINDAAGKSQLEVDVVALAIPASNEPRRILSLGEAKWDEVMGIGHLRRCTQLCATGGTVVWTRGRWARGAPDLVPQVCAWFEERGFDRLWVSDPQYGQCCGAHRFTGVPAPIEEGASMFEFKDHDLRTGPARL